MINPKEKAALQGMWNSAGTAGVDVPDGTYQFVILSARFHMSDKGRPQFKTKLQIKGGAEEYVGKELEINDNLETPENMGWFKKKLSRLNIACPEDFDEITDGTLAELMTGKVFEGQAKTKNDFLNVYVNRLLGEVQDGDQHTGPADKVSKDTEEESVPEDTETDTEISAEGYEEGTAVTWNGKAGTVIELQDDGKYRIKAEDGKVYRVDKSLVSAAEEGETEEETIEDDGDAKVYLPTPEEAESLPAAEVKKVLKELGIEAAKVKNPRAVLHGIATIAEDPKAKLQLTEIAPLVSALNLEGKFKTPKDATTAIVKAVETLLN